MDAGWREVRGVGERKVQGMGEGQGQGQKAGIRRRMVAFVDDGEWGCVRDRTASREREIASVGVSGYLGTSSGVDRKESGGGNW